MVRFRSLAAIVFLVLSLASSSAAADPGEQWMMVADPAAAGWSAEGLAAARGRAEEIGSSAVLVIDSGRVVAAWGDVERRFRSASLRKSLVSALYGPAIERGLVQLDVTVGELGIDDHAGLSDVEKEAKLRDLLASRSGIYLPAAKTTESQERQRPARGSHAPGTHWFYNNWDFNVAGVVLAKATGKEPGELFLEQIAEPTGMQDFRASDFYWELEPRISLHPAFDVRISTRDLARLGQLYLNRGLWNGRRVLSASWIDESTGIVTPFGDGSGYGYMWWINPERSSAFGFEGDPESPATFAAVGAGAQILYVDPAKQLVIVHRGDTDNGNGVDESRALELIGRIVKARQEGVEAKGKVALTAIRATPFASAKPEPPTYEAIELRREAIAELTGVYAVGTAMQVELFEHEGRLFASQQGRSEVQLFARATDALFARSLPLTIEVRRDADGRVTALDATLKGRPMHAVRQAPAAPDPSAATRSE